MHAAAGDQNRQRLSVLKFDRHFFGTRRRIFPPVPSDKTYIATSGPSLTPNACAELGQEPLLGDNALAVHHEKYTGCSTPSCVIWSPLIGSPKYSRPYPMTGNPQFFPFSTALISSPPRGPVRSSTALPVRGWIVTPWMWIVFRNRSVAVDAQRLSHVAIELLRLRPVDGVDADAARGLRVTSSVPSVAWINRPPVPSAFNS